MQKVKEIAIKYWREITIALLVIFVAISVRTCKQHIDNEDVAIHARDSAYTVIKLHKLINGQIASQIQGHEVTITQLKNDLGLSKDSLKHLKSQVGSLKNLVSIQKGRVSAKDTFKVHLHDTVYVDNKGVKEEGKKFEWSNKYLDLRGFIPNDETSIAIQYHYNVNFSLVTYRKPRLFTDYLKFRFKQQPLVADLTFDDPNILVKKFSGVVIKDEPKKWYQTKGFIFGLGVVGGIIVWKQLQ